MGGLAQKAGYLANILTGQNRLAVVALGQEVGDPLRLVQLQGLNVQRGRERTSTELRQTQQEHHLQHLLKMKGKGTGAGLSQEFPRGSLKYLELGNTLSHDGLVVE